MLLGYGYMRNKLVRLGGYHTDRDVADCHISFIFILYLNMIKRNDALTDISPFEANWDEQKSI